MNMQERKITWRRTEIGGDSEPCDFTAYIDGASMGRIRREEHLPVKGKWKYSYLPGVPSGQAPGHGLAPNREAAISALLACYELHRLHRWIDARSPGEEIPL